MINSKLFENHKVVFLHIPKTAGMTFTSILKSQFEESHVFPAYQAVKLRTDFGEHERKYQLFAGHWDYSDIEKFEEKPIILTFIRDPIERIASQFYHLKKSPDDAIAENRIGVWDRHLVELTKSMEFEEFCCYEDSDIERMANLQTRHIAGQRSKIPSDSHSDVDKTLNSALENLKEIDFIGIVEHFDLSIKLFFDMFNVDEKALDYKSININKVRPREIDREVFESNPLAKSRVELDLALYDSAITLFHEKLALHNLQ